MPGGWIASVIIALALFREAQSGDPRVVVLMQSHVSYTQRPVVQRFERPILNSWAVRHRQDPTALEQRIALLRIYSVVGPISPGCGVSSCWCSRHRGASGRRPGI